jgi:hypothetical protein
MIVVRPPVNEPILPYGMAANVLQRFCQVFLRGGVG